MKKKAIVVAGLAGIGVLVTFALVSQSKRTFSPFMNASAAAGVATDDVSGYHLLKRIYVPGDDFWDYLTFDQATHRLFIAHGTKVDVVDVNTDKVIGEISDTQGVHGVALAPELNRGFASDGRAAQVTIFDLKTLAPIGTAKTGDNPDAIVYDPATKRVFTMNGRSANATAIDAATGDIAGTIPLGGKPEFAVADGKGHIYVNLEDKSEELEINSKALKVTRQWSMAPCQNPTGLAMDVAHQRLFAGCGNKLLAVMDARAGRMVTTLPIGEGVDANRFDPGTGYILSSNGQSSTMTVIREDAPDKYTVLDNIPTARGARTMEVNLQTHEVYLVTAQFGPTPVATAENPHPRPAIVPGTFVVLVLGRESGPMKM
jgi:DNA-binding beta-propeller fold protein YncE